ncbi:hypothetical protein Dfer_3403 [Dyadobacter fermentans DSM 18053]|uniref:Uncharacterized protein n=1 Tax=Dyadobacter fermentans (strain ATCC 700827 / DSM 18053 / CIP 107007 / KCTC 52180 / NS114) TaxID=471854 RepID=C6VSW8_DYAFD|nr:hypothetical protein Dfer_3403 [Dyadobacter fermentans DSM 18053]
MPTVTAITATTTGLIANNTVATITTATTDVSVVPDDN